MPVLCLSVSACPQQATQQACLQEVERLFGVYYHPEASLTHVALKVKGRANIYKASAFAGQLSLCASL